MDKPAVAHGRIMNAMRIAFPAFLTGLISAFARCLETLTEFIGSLRLEALGQPRELQRGGASVATSLFGCGFRI